MTKINEEQFGTKIGNSYCPLGAGGDQGTTEPPH
jgi:hypothetical protein